MQKKVKLKVKLVEKVVTARNEVAHCSPDMKDPKRLEEFNDTMTAFAKAIDEEVRLRKAVKQNVKSRTFTNSNRKKVTKDGTVMCYCGSQC